MVFVAFSFVINASKCFQYRSTAIEKSAHPGNTWECCSVLMLICDRFINHQVVCQKKTIPSQVAAAESIECKTNLAWRRMLRVATLGLKI